MSRRECLKSLLKIPTVGQFVSNSGLFDLVWIQILIRFLSKLPHEPDVFKMLWLQISPLSHENWFSNFFTSYKLCIIMDMQWTSCFVWKLLCFLYVVNCQTDGTYLNESRYTNASQIQHRNKQINVPGRDIIIQVPKLTLASGPYKLNE